jgi:hypothetical protein
VVDETWGKLVDCWIADEQEAVDCFKPEEG